MKKLALILVAMFAGSMIFAQTATINQTNLSPIGSTVDATVTQTGAHLTEITQVNDKVNNGLNDISATVVQKKAINANNQVYINQTATGTGNGVAILKIETTQEGDDNVATQTQESEDYAAVTQTFTAKQKGTSNELTQYSNNGGFIFDAEQSGVDNEGIQRADAGAGKNNTGILYQKGSNNYASQLFGGTNARDGNIEQNGDRNEAWQTFEGGDYGTSSKSIADIDQYGNDDDATQYQNGIGSYQYILQDGSGFNAVDQNSIGNYNMAYAKQTGSNGIIDIDQISTAGVGDLTDGNVARVSQAGDASNAKIWQGGERNVVEGLNPGDFAKNNNGSSLDVYQRGWDNTVMSSQTAFGASETIVQGGMNNTAIVIQN